jgi:hypothetical protein
MQHNWRTLVPSREPAHMVRGTEIEMSIPDGQHSRFAIYAVRTTQWLKDASHYNGGYVQGDCTYRIRDAHTVSDAELRAGKRPDIAANFATLDECEAWIILQNSA